MPDSIPDNFGTLFPSPPPAGPPPDRTQGGGQGDTDPSKDAPSQPAWSAEATLQWSGASSVEGPLSDIPRKIVELGIVRKDQWDAAVNAASNPMDVPAVLRELRKLPSHREIRGEPPLPALTDFQLQQILSGNIDRLRFHHHLILDRLGKGGMGEVFKVWNMNLQRPEAIKTVLSEYSTGETAGATHARDRFEREARVLAQLAHPCITTIYQFGREHGVDFLAMEYVRGRDMKSIVEEAEADGEEIPVWWAAERISAIAEALEHAHEMGVIHRDIKPSNIMITENEELKVLDMGIARLVNPGGGDLGTTRLTQAAVGLGTPEVMSPEQWADATAVTPESDIYSLGCTFFYVLTGRMPFKADNLNGLMFAHVNDVPPRVSSLRPDVPKGIDDILAKMLAKEPSDRFRNCRELVAALAPYTEPEERPLSTTSSKLPLAAAALAAVVVLLLLVVALPQFLGKKAEGPTPIPETAELWPARQEATILKQQASHRDIWPTVASLESWVKDKGLAVDSQRSLDELVQQIQQETAAREKLREANLSQMQKIQQANPTVWSDASLLEQQVLREVDPALLTDPSKAEELKTKFTAINRDAYRKHLVGQVAALQKAHPQVWGSEERLLQEIPDIDEIDTPDELSKAMAKLQAKTWELKAMDWAAEFQEDHKLTWLEKVDVDNFMDEILSVETVLNATTFEKLQEAVRRETQIRIRHWVEMMLQDFQANHAEVWPNEADLVNVVTRQFSMEKLDDDQSLRSYMENVEALTYALQHPFENLRLPATGDKAVDNDVQSLLAVYESLVEAIANKSLPPAKIDLEAYVDGNPTPIVRSGMEYDYKIRADTNAYLTMLVFASDEAVYLFQFTGALEANEEATLVLATAEEPGTDRLVAFLTSENPLDKCVGSDPTAYPFLGALKARAMRLYSDGGQDSLVPMKLVKDAFPYPEVWNRVQHSIAVGEPMPGYVRSGKNELLGRKSIDVRVE